MRLLVMLSWEMTYKVSAHAEKTMSKTLRGFDRKSKDATIAKLKISNTRGSNDIFVTKRKHECQGMVCIAVT